MEKCIFEETHAHTLEETKKRALKENEVAKICNVFRLLGEPSRFKIVYALLQGELCVYHLAELTGGTVSNVSHQLRILRDNGIVKTRRIGKNIEYSIADHHIKNIIEMGLEHLQCQAVEA